MILKYMYSLILLLESFNLIFVLCFVVIFYFSIFLFFIFCWILDVHTNNGVVLSIEDASNTMQKPQDITFVDEEFQQQHNRHFVSNRTHSLHGNPGGGVVPSWQGRCPHCYQEYANISSLKYHVRLVHSEANNTICCYLCPQNFSTKLVMREHLYSCHNVKYQWIFDKNKHSFELPKIPQ